MQRASVALFYSPLETQKSEFECFWLVLVLTLFCRATQFRRNFFLVMKWKRFFKGIVIINEPRQPAAGSDTFRSSKKFISEFKVFWHQRMIKYEIWNMKYNCNRQNFNPFENKCLASQIHVTSLQRHLPFSSSPISMNTSNQTIHQL